MTKQVTFEKLHGLLSKLGFLQAPVNGPYLLLEHKSSGTLLPFRQYRRNERVDPLTLSGVRKMLDERGLLERDEFEEALHEASTKGAAKSKKK